MSKSSYLTRIASAAILATGYLAGADSAYAQSKPQTNVPVSSSQSARQNRILSRNEENSATGEGVLLKDFIYNVNLVPNTKVSLDSAFGLYAQKGNVSYEVVSGRTGLRRVLSELKSAKKPTGKEKASIDYIQGLLGKTWENDANSVGALEMAVKDKIIDVEKEAKDVLSGRYVFVAKSRSLEGYNANSIPIIVDIKNSYHPHKAAPAVKQKVPVVSSSAKKEADKRNAAKEKALRDNLALEQRKLEDLRRISAERAERQKFVADSIIRENRYKFVKDSLAREDSLSLVAKNKALEERKKFVKDSTEEAKKVAAREKFVADSVAEAIKSRKQNARFGIEVGYGTNNELVTGAFLEFPLNSTVSLEGYGNYFASSGNAYTPRVKSDTTLRERELIGPGTYKQRTDVINTTSKDEATAEAGLGLLLKAENFRFHFRGGAAMVSQEEEIDGKSTILFERNMLPLGQPETITNSMSGKKKNLTQSSFSAGALYDLNKNLALGASFNQVGKRSGGRINLRVRF